MYSRFHLVMLLSILLLIVFLPTSWHAMQRLNDFEQGRFKLASAALRATGDDIETRIRTLQDRVQRFATEHSAQILELADNPDDQAVQERLRLALAQRFTDVFAFTITDRRGRPLLEDIEDWIGPACARDLRRFSKLVVSRGAAYHNSPRLHPQPGHFHFDIMASWTGHYRDFPQGGVFFVSFRPALLSELLNKHRLSGFQTLLVKDDDPGLIEVSGNGSRDRLARPARLSAEETERVFASRPVAGTGWRLLLLTEQGAGDAFRRAVWLDAVATLALASAAMLLLVAGFGLVQRRGRPA